jgi:hypothetical protein
MDFYTLMYNDANGMQAKLTVLQEAAGTNFSDSSEFYAWVLDRAVLEYPTVQGNQNMEAANTIARFAIRQLADAQYQAAAQNIWRVVDAYPDAVVRSDAIIALGKLGAKEFVPQIVRLLQDLNARPASDLQAGEQLAGGAITALESYQEPVGYLPVFFASVGWYTERIKSQAAAALPNILEDPTESMLDVIQSSAYPYDAKYTALRAIEQATISNDKKAAVAVVALGEGWRSSTSNPRLRMELAQIRKLSLDMIRRYGTADAAVYPLLDRSYRDGLDEEERFGAVTALASLATDESVRLLASYLTVINMELQDGSLTQAGERMVRILIPALGATRHTGALTVLRSVQAKGWTHAVKALATDALRNIPTSGVR